MSIVKWVGGKNRLLRSIEENFPKNITGNYYEPFVGGGSVLLWMIENCKIDGKIIASDINPYLIAMYKNIQSDCNKVIRKLNRLINRYNGIDTLNCTEKKERNPQNVEESIKSKEAYYYWIRAKFNAMETDAKISHRGSAIFLFLNRTAFRGIYREGPNGFNVPFGNYSLIKNVGNDFLEFETKIKNIEFRCNSFVEIMDLVRCGDFVYLDPPYVPIKCDSFVGYVAGGFNLHEKLFKWCLEMKKKKINWIMSNSNSKLVHDTFSRCKIIEIDYKHVINPKKQGKKVIEILVVP